MSLSELNHRRNKRDERTNFEKAAESPLPPVSCSDLSFGPFFPNGISFVGSPSHLRSNYLIAQIFENRRNRGLLCAQTSFFGLEVLN